MIDPVELTAQLVRCPSVTPEEGGAIALLEQVLAPLGFACTRIARGGVENLYAKHGGQGGQGGPGAPVFAFAGHVDVVPPGEPGAWRHEPFAAEIAEGCLWGRGAVDMKSGVGAFVAAVSEFVAVRPDAAIALLITGDEEGEAVDGTAAILDWMRTAGETADFCLVGEPTSAIQLGDTVKIGRRGSLSGTLTVTGRQGHSAYPQRALNPLPSLARLAAALAEMPLDEGSEHFQPSTLALTSIDTGNPAANVIPAAASVRFNIRFNDRHSAASLQRQVAALVERETADSGLAARLDWASASESFLTQPDARVEAVVAAIAEATGVTPALTTGGGTSDARFIKDLCPVIEFGLVGETMHAVDERVPVDQLRALAEVYTQILHCFFAAEAAPEA